MKVVLAFDKFKGSVTSQQLSEAAQACLCGLDDVKTVCVPVADGGDGTTTVLAATRHGQWVTVPTMGPLLQQAPVNASYFLTDDGTALIEVAAASGLALLPPDGRDVMRASTFGTGMLMRDAMERGSRDIVLGLGGSATCDAAMGILCALGAEFFDSGEHHLFPNGENLEKIVRIETFGIPQTVRDCRFTLLTDVDNPLCGERGSARIYAPQKGASPEQVEQLERGMMHVATLVGEDSIANDAEMITRYTEVKYDLWKADFDPSTAGLCAAVAVSEGLPLAEAMDPEGTLLRVAQHVRAIVNDVSSS